MWGQAENRTGDLVVAVCFTRNTADMSSKSVLADAVQWGEQMTLKNRGERKKMHDGHWLKPNLKHFFIMYSLNAFGSSYLFGWVFSLKIGPEINCVYCELLVFTCVWMCWIMVPVFESLVVSSPHTFLSKYSDQGRPLSSKIVQPSHRLITPLSPFSSTCNLICSGSFSLWFAISFSLCSFSPHPDLMIYSE